MLQGTFETLSLPEVFGLLAGARKSGALHIEAGDVAGRVYLADGHCHAVDATGQLGPIQDGGDLLVRLVDLCFASMCRRTGSFRFEADEAAPWSCTERVELSDALVEAERLLKQWHEIVRVIPSLECRPCLLETLQVEELVLDHQRWALLVAIDGRRTVREIVQRTDRPVMDVGQTLLELVEAGAVGVVDPAAARAAMEVEAEVDARPAEVPIPEVPIPEVPPPAAPVLTIVPEVAPRLEVAARFEVEPEPQRDLQPEPPVDRLVGADDPCDRTAEAVSDVNDSEGPDRGAFLRLFSGLRES